jgi:hypothetical protein
MTYSTGTQYKSSFLVLAKADKRAVRYKHVSCRSCKTGEAESKHHEQCETCLEDMEYIALHGNGSGVLVFPDGGTLTHAEENEESFIACMDALVGAAKRETAAATAALTAQLTALGAWPELREVRVCVGVCVCEYVCGREYACVFACVCVCVSMPWGEVRVCVVRENLCEFLCVLSMNVCIDARALNHLHNTHTHTHTHTLIHTHIHTHIHTYTHPHTHAPITQVNPHTLPAESKALLNHVQEIGGMQALTDALLEVG